MENRSNRIIEVSTGSIIAIMLILFGNLPFLSSVGVGLFVLFSIKFFNSIGNSIEIRDLMIVMALLQWIIGPSLILV